MSFKYLKHEEIDYSRWDQCVNAAANGNIYSLSWYLNIVSPGWDGIVQATTNGYQVVMAVPHFRKFKIFRFALQPPFVNQLGVIHQVPISDEHFLEIVKLFISKFNYVSRYPFNIENQSVGKSAQVSEKIQITENGSYELHLSNDYKTIAGNFSADRRKNIDRSLKNNLILQPCDTVDQLIALHKQFNAPKIFGGVSLHHYEILRRLYLASKREGLSELMEVTSHGRVVSMCLFYYFRHRIIKFCNVSTDEGRKVNADSFMMHSVLAKFSNQSKVFDFERTSSPGVNHYKKSYGAEFVTYSSISYDDLPALLRTLQTFRQAVLKK